jgi:hypothetical protein
LAQSEKALVLERRIKHICIQIKLTRLHLFWENTDPVTAIVAATVVITAKEGVFSLRRKQET